MTARKERGAPPPLLKSHLDKILELEKFLSCGACSKIPEVEPYRPPKPTPSISEVGNNRKALAGTLKEFVRPGCIPEGRLAGILGADFVEIQNCLGHGCWKSAIILCGGTSEALLRLALGTDKIAALASSTAPRKKEGNVLPLENWSLKNLIDVAEELRMVREGQGKMLHGVRDYRNLVHPEIAAAGTYEISEPLARAAFHVLEVLLEDLNKLPVPRTKQ